jgi:hypothetical protein
MPLVGGREERAEEFERGAQHRRGIRTTGRSTTGDVSDVEHADSDQRQLVADLRSCCFGHVVDSSRAFRRSRIESLTSEKPGHDTKKDQGDQGKSDP